LLKTGANSTQRTAENAASAGYMNIVEILIEYGVINWNDMVYYAAEGGHLDIVKLMLDRSTSNLRTVMDVAAKDGHLDIVEYPDRYKANKAK